MTAASAAGRDAGKRRAQAALAVAQERAEEKARKRPFGKVWRGKRQADPRWRRVACNRPAGLMVHRPGTEAPTRERAFGIGRKAVVLHEAHAALLKFGPASATELEHITGTPRGTWHDRLKRLARSKMASERRGVWRAK